MTAPPLDFEPIAAFSAMMMTLKGARLEQPELEAELGQLSEQARQTRASNVAAWVPLYRGALALVPRVIAAQASIEERREGKQRAQASQQQLAAAVQAAQSALTRATSDWQARIDEQVKGRDGLAGKAERSVEKLAVVALDDPATGQTTYRIDPAQLDGFVGWLGGNEAKWAENNGKLVAVRAGEALVAEGVTFPPGITFELAPLALDAGPPRLKLQGHSTPTPSRFELVGATFKTIMTGFASVSGIGFIAPRILGASADLTRGLSVLFGLMLLGAVAFAAATVPTRIRQGRELLRQRASREVHRELLVAVEKRLGQVGELHLRELKRHFAAESARLRALGRNSAPEGVASPQPAFGVGGVIGGLMPRDIEKLKGEWPAAIRARLSELEARGLA
jgi:hypothetical protein